MFWGNEKAVQVSISVQLKDNNLSTLLYDKANDTNLQWIKSIQHLNLKDRYRR